MRRNKRGSLIDVFFIGLLALACAIGFVAGYMMLAKVNDKIQVDANIAPQGKAIIQATEDRMVAWFDGVFIVVLIGMWIGSIVLAWQIPSHPIFFFISIIVYIIMIVVSAVIGNTYYDFSVNAGIVDYANDFTIIPMVMNNFVEIMLFMGFVVGMVMFMRTKGE